MTYYTLSLGPKCCFINMDMKSVVKIPVWILDELFTTARGCIVWSIQTQELVYPTQYGGKCKYTYGMNVNVHIYQLLNR